MAFAGRILSLSLAALVVAVGVASKVVADPPQKAASTSRVKSTSNKAKSTRAESAASSRKPKNDPPASRFAPISRTRETAAVNFARKHHAELASLLEGLKKNDVRNFQAGLRDLTREAERLTKMAERDDERYQVSLELWKVESRLRLEVARLSMSPGEDFDVRLRPLIQQQHAARIRLINIERKRLTDRLVRYDDQLKTLTTDPEKLVDSEIARFQKSVAGRTRSRGTRPQTPTESSNSATAQSKTKQSKRKTPPTRSKSTTSAD